MLSSVHLVPRAEQQVLVMCRVAEVGNAAFAAEISKWVFQEQGVLRASNLTHHMVGSTGEPEIYRVTDQAEFSVDISELQDGKWVPYRWVCEDSGGLGDVRSEDMRVGALRVKLGKKPECCSPPRIEDCDYV